MTDPRTPPTKARPLPYSAEVERPQPNEDQVLDQLNRTFHDIQATTLADYGHPVRPVHAKSHAIVEGELTIPDDLPEELAQGVFARPGTHPVILRFSTNPGDVLDDAVSAPRGLAIKVLGVEGERLPDSQGDSTQDFILVNGPAFSAKDGAAFAKNLTLLAATTDTGQGWKKAMSAAFRGAESALDALGSSSPTLTTLGGQPLVHPLGDTYYSQTPFRHGDHIAKFAIAPVSAELKRLKDTPVEVSGRPNALREEMIDAFRSHGGEWEFRAQLRTNADTMPIEDATVVWPEDESPYRTVARITVAPQPAWSEERAARVDDGLSFSPWHGLAAHRPLGSINRARRGVYQKAADFRGQHVGCPMGEPTSRVRLSDAPAATYGRSPGREGRRPGTPDARDGQWTQPLSPTARKLAAGAAAGLVGGLVLSALMARKDMGDGPPSELVILQRRTAAQIKDTAANERAPSSLGEALSAHGGHLALSAVTGAISAAVRPAGSSPVTSGLVSGTLFYGLAYGLLGPALGVSPPLWRDSKGSIAQHGALHLLFGLISSFGTDALERRMGGLPSNTADA